MNHFQTEGKRTLLVEGPDDEHVIKSICGQLRIGIIDECLHGNQTSQGKLGSQGKEALLQALPTHLKGSDRSSIGIVLDADENLDGSWQAIRKKLIESGYTGVPEHPDPAGTVVLPPPEPTILPRVGIWLMPDNELDGTLEKFLSLLVPENDDLLPLARRTISDMPKKRFTEAHAPKALMHTWLAWQKEPGKPYGQAITARYLDTSLPIAQTFANWLRRTFFE